MNSNWLRLAVALAFEGGLLAGTVPGRYIVELTTESVAENVIKQSKGSGIHNMAASPHRAMVREQQQRVRDQLGSRATVLDSIDTVANALFVKTDQSAAELASLPGVRRVHPVRTVHMLLDRAVVVNKVTDAWNQIGMDRAG